LRPSSRAVVLDGLGCSSGRPACVCLWSEALAFDANGLSNQGVWLSMAAVSTLAPAKCALSTAECQVSTDSGRFFRRAQPWHEVRKGLRQRFESELLLPLEFTRIRERHSHHLSTAPSPPLVGDTCQMNAISE